MAGVIPVLEAVEWMWLRGRGGVSGMPMLGEVAAGAALKFGLIGLLFWLEELIELALGGEVPLCSDSPTTLDESPSRG